MTPFFRRIRRKLANDNQFLKYSRYAIGEILLVVVGILLALQINNWNEEVKNKKQENQILFQLKEEYQENLAEIDLKIRMRKEMLNACGSLLNYYDDSKDWIIPDSVALDFTFTIGTPTFNPAIGVTNELLSSGKLYIVENKRLKQMLTNWSGVTNRLIEYEEDLRNYSENYYVPYLQDNHSYRDLFGYSKKEKGVLNTKIKDKTDLIENLLNDKNLEDYIFYVAVLIRRAENDSKKVREQIIDILKIINMELNHK